MTIMTRTTALILTAIAAALYAGLGIAFADDYFTGPFLVPEAWADSSALSWLLLGAIVLGGLWQMRRIPAYGAVIDVSPAAAGETSAPVWWRLIMGNSHLAILWMPIRLFVGREWLASGEHKLRGTGWLDGGSSLQGYWENAVAIPESGQPAITYGWFRGFLQFMLDHESYTWFAWLIAFGEFLVGLGLIAGALIGIAAFFGSLMNFNFMLAGAGSANPVLFALGVLLVLGWKVAGYVGLDRILLPALGTPWQTDRPVLTHRGAAARTDRFAPRHPRTTQESTVRPKGRRTGRSPALCHGDHQPPRRITGRFLYQLARRQNVQASGCSVQLLE